MAKIKTQSNTEMDEIEKEVRKNHKNETKRVSKIEEKLTEIKSEIEIANEERLKKIKERQGRGEKK